MMFASQVMVASPNDVRSANDVCLAAHWGKHRIIATVGSNIILSEAKNIISPQAMHHLKYFRETIEKYQKMCYNTQRKAVH